MTLLKSPKASMNRISPKTTTGRNRSDVSISITSCVICLLRGRYLLPNELAASHVKYLISALADLRVAEERTAAKEVTIAELRTVASAKEQLLSQRDEENVQLKEQIAVLQTSLRNEVNKTDEKMKLLDEAKDQFVATLSEPVTETLEKLNAENQLYSYINNVEKHKMNYMLNKIRLMKRKKQL